MPDCPSPTRRRAWHALGLVLGLLCAPLRADEAADIASALGVRPGLDVADVGAGQGEWTLALADRVGAHGSVWATEVDSEALATVRVRAAEAGHDNVRVVLGTQTDTGLPADCCDAILLRMVYHHFTDPPRMRRDLLRSLRPGGRLAVIDVTPQRHWRRLEGVPERGGHGIEPDELVSEMTAAGFEFVSRTDAWDADPDRYCVVFRRPLR